jgi:hypothetical protein
VKRHAWEIVRCTKCSLDKATPGTKIRTGAINSPKKQKRFRDFLLGHAIAFFFCVVFPGLVTAVAPVSWVTFERQGDDVVANAKTCTLFFIPYQNKTIDPVVGVGDHFISGTYSRRTGNRESTRSEDQAFLMIHGEGESRAKVPVSPVNIKNVTERAEAFLKDTQSTKLKMFVVANWKFSVLAGGAISFLTAIYVLGVTLSIFQGIGKLIRYLSAPSEPLVPRNDH